MELSKDVLIVIGYVALTALATIAAVLWSA